jgi:hypothetical protein
MIVSQFELGIATADCGVFLILTNGHLYQFGFIALLEPCFPVLHIVSNVLDALQAPNKIAIFLDRMKGFAILQSGRVAVAARERRGATIMGNRIEISTKAYFVKNTRDVFSRRGTKLDSLLALWAIFRRLSDAKIEEAVIPLAIRSGKFDPKDYLSNDILVFPRLSAAYRMGVPAKEDDFVKYIATLTAVLKRIHRVAKVVHLDGYPSNILWWLDGEEMKIKIIDWDVAHFVDVAIDKSVMERMVSGPAKDYYWLPNPPVLSATERHDAWYIFVCSLLTEDERKASNDAACNPDNSTAVRLVNTAYVTAQERIITERSDRKALNAEFDEWFANEWKEGSK